MNTPTLKIYGCWICFNNAQTIRHSILSILAHIDEVIVIDGSFEGKRSDDGTWELVEGIREQFPEKPVTHVKSSAKSLYEKHQEHVDITGNNDPSVWTWQVDSDEVYLPKHAANVAKAIRSNQFNGVGVRLITVNAIREGIALTDTDPAIHDTVQMRAYRMARGLTFSTEDGIFEHIVYSDGSPVQRQDNKIYYGSLWDDLLVFNYHCLEPIDATIRRYTHYNNSSPSEFAKTIRSESHNKHSYVHHPLSHIWRA